MGVHDGIDQKLTEARHTLDSMLGSIQSNLDTQLHRADSRLKRTEAELMLSTKELRVAKAELAVLKGGSCSWEQYYDAIANGSWDVLNRVRAALLPAHTAYPKAH